jgi:flagellar protein FlaG
MALEVVKTSTYNNNINQVAASFNTADSKGIDSIVEAMKNQTQGSNLTEQEDREATASKQHIKSEISKANNRLRSHNTRCEFSYHEETRRVSIKVMDKETEEVIREIPPEKTLEMIEKMWELVGLLVDEKR